MPRSASTASRRCTIALRSRLSKTTQVWVYAGGLFIECRPQGGYLLPLAMVEYEGEEIEPMERQLYEFEVSEGNIEREP